MVQIIFALFISTMAYSQCFSPEAMEEIGDTSPEFEVLSQVNIGYEDIYTKNKPTAFTHYLNLDLIHFEGSDWTSQEISRELINVANIFRQCKLKLNTVKITKVKYAQKDLSFDANISLDEEAIRKDFGSMENAVVDIGDPIIYKYIDFSRDHMNLFAHLPNDVQQNPTVFLVNKITSEMEDWLSDVVGLAYTENSSPGMSHVCFVEPNNSAFARFGRLLFGDDGYSVMAHEIVHSVGNRPHNKVAPSLMAEADLANGTYMLEEECDALKASSFVYEL